MAAGWGVSYPPLNNTEVSPPVPAFIHWLENEYFNPRALDHFFSYFWGVSYVFAFVYLLTIFTFKRLMSRREAFDLRLPLILWSSALAIFSTFGAYRFLFGFYLIYKNHGLKGTLCSTYYYNSSPEGFWVAAFVLSKVPELFDTFFIVARKKNLIFLHYYHHATVLIYSWFLYKDRLAGGAYYGTMNFTVHAIMYTYYALTAARIRVSKKISMLVTTLQTAQMFVGVFVTVYLWFHLYDEDCPITAANLIMASLMYSTYLGLFAKFFYDSYVAPRHDNKKKSE